MPTQSARISLDVAAVEATLTGAAVHGLQLGMEHLLQVSRSVVPIEEDTLERSGVASVDPATCTGAVSYDTPYAVKQHEDLTARHDPGRTAKYLERPAVTEADTVLDIVAASIRRATQ